MPRWAQGATLPPPMPAAPPASRHLAYRENSVLSACLVGWRQTVTLCPALSGLPRLGRSVSDARSIFSRRFHAASPSPRLTICTTGLSSQGPPSPGGLGLVTHFSSAGAAASLHPLCTPGPAASRHRPVRRPFLPRPVPAISPGSPAPFPAGVGLGLPSRRVRRRCFGRVDFLAVPSRPLPFPRPPSSAGHQGFLLFFSSLITIFQSASGWTPERGGGRCERHIAPCVPLSPCSTLFPIISPFPIYFTIS